jgi:hypothetical protein
MCRIIVTRAPARFLSSLRPLNNFQTGEDSGFTGGESYAIKIASRRQTTKKENGTMKTYILATERNGNLVALDLPAMAMRQAETHAQSLRNLMPNVPVYVINTQAV